MTIRANFIGAAVVAAITLFAANATHAAASKTSKNGARPLGFSEAREIAEEGFIYGLPLVMNYAVNYEFSIDKHSSQYKGPFNQLHNESRVFTYKDTAVVTPNSDTPYSFLGADLRAEPLVITVPAIEKSRYYSVQLVDWNTFNFGYIGSRATASAAGSYLVAGPNWKGPWPVGIRKVFNSTSDFAIILFRTQLFGPDDMPNVVKVQEQYKVQPLSAYLKKPAPPAAPAVNWPPINKELMKENFFEYLDFVLQFAPAGPEEKDIRARLARIGVGPGKTFSFKNLSPEHKAEIVSGMKEGEKKVEERLATAGKRINGWTIMSPFGDRSFYKGDWMLRAAAAKGGIYGNDAVEATYPMTRWLPDGELLDGKNNYTLTFPAGQLPPVNAFWSVTMYDGKTQLLIENPINRYLINSPMLPGMTTNSDGSLTFYIQKDSPGADKEANWLPAPDGPIYMVMRLYWPKTQPPSILPAGEGNWKPPGLVKTN